MSQYQGGIKLGLSWDEVEKLHRGVRNNVKTLGTGECFIERYCLLFQKISPTVPLQYLHLLDCNLVELYQAFALRHTVVDKDDIDILHV